MPAGPAPMTATRRGRDMLFCFPCVSGGFLSIILLGSVKTVCGGAVLSPDRHNRYTYAVNHSL